MSFCGAGGRQHLVVGRAVRGHQPDAVVPPGADPWDTVVGAGLVQAAGGTVTDVHGDPWRHDSVGLVASNGAAHDEVLAAARTAERDH